MEQEERIALDKFTSDFTYNQLVALLMELQSQHKQLKSQTGEAWEHVCHVARSIIPNKMDAEQIQNITVILPDDTKKQLLCIDQVSVKTPPENKEALWEWLREHDAAELITETVNSSTLAAYVREQMRQAEPYPNDLCEVSTYATASLRKAS